MFVDAEGGSSNARADQSPIGVIRCFDAESGQLAPPSPHFPTSSLASLATIQPSKGLSIQITRDLIRHWSSALPSAYRPSPPCVQKVLFCFLLTRLCSLLPYQKPFTASNITSQWVASERNPQSALCVWPTPLQVAQRYDLYYCWREYTAC